MGKARRESLSPGSSPSRPGSLLRPSLFALPITRGGRGEERRNVEGEEKGRRVAPLGKRRQWLKSGSGGFSHSKQKVLPIKDQCWFLF